MLTVVTQQGRQSLWLRNLPTGSVTQVVAPSGRTFSSLAFSPDGSYIYYRRFPRNPLEVSTCTAPRCSAARRPSSRRTWTATRPFLPQASSSLTYAPTTPRSASGDCCRPMPTAAMRRYCCVTEGTNDPDSIGWSPDDKRIAIVQDKPSRGDFGSQIIMFPISLRDSRNSFRVSMTWCS